MLGGRDGGRRLSPYEARRSAQVLPALRGLAGSGWLDEPIEIVDDSDILAIERIRRAVFGGTEDKPRQHLGEAQTCYVILNWAGFAGSWWISDDREALRYARFQGITTRETIDLINIAVVNGDIAARDGFDLMVKMADSGRHLRLPHSAEDLRR